MVRQDSKQDEIGSLFLVLAAVLCAAVVLAHLAATDVYYLTGSRAIMDDGLSRGSTAPAWSLPDSSGEIVCSPPQKKPFQLIMFSDHSLKSFPSVIEGLRDLIMHAEPQLEIVVLMRRPSDLAEPMLRLLGLADVPIVTGSSALYGKYNVRVIPFVIFVDSKGQVRGSSLVNHSWQLDRLWQLANVAPETGVMPATGRLRRRARAAV